MKIIRLAAIPLTMVAAIALKWFYWVGPLLMIGAILFLLALGVGYYVRVLRPKYRGRPVNK